MGLLKIRGIDHVVLRVRDLDRALRFYCELLGCSEERRLPELGLVQLRAGASLIDLVDVAGALGSAGGPAAGSQGRNMDHFALQLEDFEEESLRRALSQAGVEAAPAAPRYGAEGMGPSLYIQDPDGNLVELKGPGESRQRGPKKS